MPEKYPRIRTVEVNKDQTLEIEEGETKTTWKKGLEEPGEDPNPYAVPEQETEQRPVVEPKPPKKPREKYPSEIREEQKAADSKFIREGIEELKKRLNKKDTEE